VSVGPITTPTVTVPALPAPLGALDEPVRQVTEPVVQAVTQVVPPVTQGLPLTTLAKAAPQPVEPSAAAAPEAATQVLPAL
jgi:hypothetical protein